MSLRAELLRLTEKWHESLAQADKVLAMETGHTWIKGTKAATLTALSRSQEALDVLAPVLEELPGYLFGQSYRIVALDQLDRVTEAQQVMEEHFSEAAEGAWAVWTVMARSQLLIDAAQYEDAARILKEALRGGRDEASWYGPLAVAHARLGRPRRAVDTMRKAFAGTNGNLAEWARVELADALSLLPQGADGEARDEAREIYQWLASKQDHETAPKDVALRAWSQFRLGKPDDAITRYRAAIDAAADPMLNERFQLGIALVMAGGPESGRSTLDRVLADLADIADRAAAKGLAMEALHVLELLKKDTQFTAKAVDFAEVREQLSALACLTPT